MNDIDETALLERYAVGILLGIPAPDKVSRWKRIKALARLLWWRLTERG